MSKYIMYCNNCESLMMDHSDLKCNLCLNKMEDVSFIDTIEEAIWWGQKHPKVSIAPGVEWELAQAVKKGKDKW